MPIGLNTKKVLSFNCLGEAESRGGDEHPTGYGFLLRVPGRLMQLV